MLQLTWSWQPALYLFLGGMGAGAFIMAAVLFLIDPGHQLAVFKLFDAVYTGEYALASLMASLIVVIVLAVEGGVYWAVGRRENGDVS